MKTAAVVRIRISALGLAMLVGSTAWASGTPQTAPGGASHPQSAAASSDCRLSNMPQVTLFNAVMQPSTTPSCAPAAEPQSDNRRAPHVVHRARSGQPLLRPDDNVRYSF